MIEIDKNLIESYLELLSNLNDASKLEIISRLSLSMQRKEEVEKEEQVSASMFYGVFEGSETAEELINDIRDARVFNRKIEDFE